MKEALLIILKFVAAAFLIPVVIGLTIACREVVGILDPSVSAVFLSGLVCYVLCKFFIYDFFQIYVFGQNMVSVLFRFSKPLATAAMYVLPFYTILVLAAYAVFKGMGKLDPVRLVLFWLSSFTFVMHIVLTAKDLYEKDKIEGKPDYFFGMSMVYVINVFLAGLIINLLAPGGSFLSFCKLLFSTALSIYTTVFRQIF